MKISPQSIAIVAATILGSNTPVYGCSRVLQNKYDHIISGRSMDWGFSFEDVLFLNPPGQEMDGGAGDMSVKWTSKYVSVYCVVCVLL
jgi:choloylglycine hydrolase